LQKGGPKNKVEKRVGKLPKEVCGDPAKSVKKTVEIVKGVYWRWLIPKCEMGRREAFAT